MGTHRYKLPDIGEGVVEAEITAWHVSIGDLVSEEDPIADAMTDKATIELTSPVDGVVKTIACDEGDMLAVGAVLVTFEIEGAGDAPEPEVENAPISTPKPGPSAKVEPKSFSAASVSRSVSSGKVLASPAVRGRAARLNIDLAVVPSESARVSHADLDAYLISAGSQSAQSLASSPQMKPSPASPKMQETPQIQRDDPVLGETRQKVIGLRRVIATRMAESKRNIPHFTYVEEIDVTELEDMRTRMNARRNDDKPKLTVLPLLIRALAVTFADWPQFIIVPVIKAAQTKSVWALALEIGRLADAARTNKLTQDDLSGATTTLTSLGPLGGMVTTPVINRPEVAIFGPNKIRDTLAMDKGEVVVRKVMNFSVSCDHRVIDGYDAAKMMQDLKARIEDPTSMFVL